jgi:hypothetical protein
MRYHSARVVLGACLVAAAAAAQAPASHSTAPERGGGLFEPSALSDSARADYGGSVPQGEVDYSLRALFLQQHGDFMNRRERFRPDIALRGRVFPNQRINGEPGSFDMFGYDFDANVNAVVSPDGYLKFGAYYSGRRYVTSTAFGTAGNASGIADETLIGTGVKLGFGVFLSDNVMLEVETAPGAWSDLDDTLHHEDFDFPSMGVFTFRSLDNLFFKLGARYNQVYEDAPWLPVLGLGWEITEGFRLDIMAPESIEMSWWPGADHNLGILFGGEVTGAEYHVHTSEAINQRDDVRVQEVVTYLGLVARLSDNISFIARSGLVVAGDYDLTTGAAGFNRSEGALDQGFFADLTFGISF